MSIGEFITTMEFWFYIFMMISYCFTYYFSQNYLISFLPLGFLIILGVFSGVFEAYFTLLIFFMMIMIIAVYMSKWFLGGKHS